jgi:hypothetical protein
LANFNRTIFVAVIALVFCDVIKTSNAADNGGRQRYGAQQRAAIRAMPILERPSRPGHFYGNAVRRNRTVKSVPKGVVSKQQESVAKLKQPHELGSVVVPADAAAGAQKSAATSRLSNSPSKNIGFFRFPE